MIEFQTTFSAQFERTEKLPDVLPEILDETVQTWAKSVTKTDLSGKKQYPPRPGSKYVRTYKLARRWRAKRTGRMIASIRNSTPYAIYVVGDGFGRGQAWMHKGIWWKFRERVKAREPELTILGEEALRRFVASGKVEVAELDVRVNRFRSPTTGRFVRGGL